MENRLEKLENDLKNIEASIEKKENNLEGYRYVIQKQQGICNELQSLLHDEKCVRNNLEYEIALLKCEFKVGDVFEVNIPCFSHVKIVRIEYSLWSREEQGYKYTLKYKAKDTKRWNGGGTHGESFLKSILQD